MIRRSLPAAAVLTLLSVPLFAQGAAWQIDGAHSNVQFAVKHMMVSTVRGQFDKVSGTVAWDGRDAAGAAVDVLVDAASVNTREAKRDAHLRSADFFDVEKFPTLVFKSTKIEPAGQGRFRMAGNLTLRGVTRPVVFDVTGPTPAIKDPGGNLRAGASATTVINRKDFGVVWNRALDGGGLVVSDDVQITIDLELISRKADAK